MENENGQSIHDAIDAPQRRRPGHPQKKAPAPAGAAHWVEPEAQPRVPGVLKDAQRLEFTATFGTGQRPKGLSGVLRRVGYQIPDYRIRRWLLLMFADRVDALEWQLGRAARSPAAWTVGLLLLGGLGITAYRRSRCRSSTR